MAYSHSSHRYTDTGMPIFTARSTTRRVDAADSLHKSNERIKELKKLGESLPKKGAEQNAPPTTVEQKQIEARVRNAAKREKDAVKDNSCCEVMAIGGKVGEKDGHYEEWHRRIMKHRKWIIF